MKLAICAIVRFQCMKANKYHEPFVQSVWRYLKIFESQEENKSESSIIHTESTGGSQGRICQDLPFLLLYL